MMKLSFLAVSVALLGCLANAQVRPAGYHLSQSVKLPSGGGWDYLAIDAANHKLYVTAGNIVDVVNPTTYKVIGELKGLSGTHGVAIADQDDHGFTSDGGSNSMTMFDLKTLKQLKQIKLPIVHPDGIIYDPASDRVFAFNHDSQAVAVDAKTGAVAGTITLPSKSAEFAAADGRGHVFDNLESSSQLLDIDAHTLKILHVWPLAPCVSPSGLAIDAAHHRLFAGCHNKLMAIVDSDTGKVVATEPIGGGVDATRFDAGTQLAFSSNGADGGSITVIHENGPDSYMVVGNIPTEAGARTMEFDPDTHTLFADTAKRNGRRPVAGTFHLLVIPNS